jgi:transcription elongation GreA/GreB family factor
MATEITMRDLLQATIDEGASDLHVRAFMPPELRVHGELVAIADDPFTEEDTYKLVGATEADPKQLFVSNESPIGAALICKKIGDSVNIEVPNGTVRLKVLEVSRA